MSNNIFEELPSRKGGAAQPMGDAAASIEKKARQLVYDSRYEVKKLLAGKKADAVAQERMVLERIAKSTAIPAVKARARQMVSKKAAVSEDFIPAIKDAAADNVAKAMFKVFVEGVEEVIPDYLEELHGLDDKKYKIRVTDPKTGNSYVRYGTREKITQLRSKGLKVELTEYGEPREGERKRGEETARATGGGSGRKLDPVGKEDNDPDNDGVPISRDKNDQYIMKRRKAIGAAIEKRQNVSASYEQEGKLVESKKSKKHKKTTEPRWQDSDGDGKWYEPEDVKKEDYLWTEGTDSTEGKNTRKVTGTGVDNYASGAIKISPPDGTQVQTGPKSVYAHTELEGELIAEKAMSKAQQRFLELVNEKMNLATAKMGDVVKDFYKSDAPQFKGKSKKKRQQMAIAAKLEADRQVKEAAECGDTDEKKKDTRGDYAKINLIKNKLRAMGAKNPIVMTASEQVISEREFDEPGEEDWRPDVRAHNKKYGGYKGGYKKPSDPKPGSGPVKGA